MNFKFQEMKPIIQQDFDHILASYPTDLSSLKNSFPVGGDPYVRKTVILETAAASCPVRLFAHYPFAFAIDVGEPREVGYVGIGNMCQNNSDVDFNPLFDFFRTAREHSLGSFNHYTDFIHRTLDHDKLLTMGFRGVYEECLAYNQSETDPQKKRYRELVMKACKATETIGLRLRKLAKEMLATEDDEDVIYNLTRIVESVNTPWEAPVTFFDAMNSILCTALFISGLDGVEMNAYGQADRLLMPFYERDLKAGRITREEAYFLLQCFLHRTDMHAHFNDERKTYDNGVSIAIGGCDPEGNPVYNEITDMILDAYRENKLINPKLNARASANSPRAYLEKLSELMQSGNNNIIVENDDYIIPMFLRMGVQPEDARTYIGNGCQEVICRNQLHSRAFLYLNLVQVLLDTLHYGRSGEPLSDFHQKIYRYGAFHINSFPELYSSYLQNLHSYIKTLTEEIAPYEKIQHLINPEPMLSAFTADCIGTGKDLTENGARYNHKTLSLVGFGTLCDSLLSLEEAYENNTLDRLWDAVVTDFSNDEQLRRKLVNSQNRFGHSQQADTFAHMLSIALAEVSRDIYNPHGVRWHTSLFTYYMFQTFGAVTGASPDGRHRGDAFSRQMNMASLPDLTTAVHSMAALTEADFHDVGMFDISLPFTVSGSPAFRQTLTDYIYTCLQQKIPVLQTNIVDRHMLLEEKANKGTHPDLVVRVCGYSAYFGQLSADMQNEIIARISQ